MDQTQNALKDIKIIKKIMDNAKNNISSFYSIFFILGIGNTIYFTLYYLFSHIIGFNGYLIMSLTIIRTTCYLIAFIKFIFILKNQINLYRQKVFIFLATCLFLIPFLIFIINTVIPFFVDSSIASNIRILLTNHYVTMSILLFCGVLIFVGFENDFTKFLIISSILIIAYIIMLVLGKEIINKDIVLLHKANMHLAISIERMFPVAIDTIGYFFLGLYLKKEVKLHKNGTT